jgi:4-hydroxybenzoyl-CoA reductase subunit beta
MSESNQYLIPESLNQALEFAAGMDGSFSFIAGGTDLMGNRKQKNNNDRRLIDIQNLPELKEFRKNPDNSFYIGAGLTLDFLAVNSEVTDKLPLLSKACRAVASPLIRKSATIGGNILCYNRCIYFNQSEFWRDAVGLCLKCGGDVCIATGGVKKCFAVYISDVCPALYCLGADLTFENHSEKVTLEMEEIFSGDGLDPLKLPPVSLLRSINIPDPGDTLFWFHKSRVRKSIDFTNLTIALAYNRVTQLLRIGLSGVDSGPVFFKGNTQKSSPELKKFLFKHSRMIDNLPFSRTYRKDLLNVLLDKGFEAVGLPL